MLLLTKCKDREFTETCKGFANFFSVFSLNLLSMDAASRLRTYIEERGISVRKFEITCGFKNGWVGDLKSSIKLSSISVIHRNFEDLNIEWWLTGDGEMIRPAQSEPSDLVSVLRKENDSLIKDKERLIEEKQEIWKMYKEIATK